MKKLMVLCALALISGCDSTDPGADGGLLDAGRRDASTPVDTGPPATCREGSSRCFGAERHECGADGEYTLSETCEAACDPSLGCVACAPGSRRCEGDVSMICTTDGMGFVTGRDCTDNGALCGSAGFCNDACGEAESTNSNVGCEYWPINLPATSSDTRFHFHVVFANPGDTVANVRITRGDGIDIPVTVAPGEVEAVELLRHQSISLGGMTYGSRVVEDRAYHVISDRPVIAAQFNPFQTYVAPDRPGPGHPIYNPHGIAVNNDASLLLPAHTFTGNYIAATYMPIAQASAYNDDLEDTHQLQQPAYIAIAGTTVEPTEVTVDYPAPLRASNDFDGSEGPTTVTFTLERGEVAVLANEMPIEAEPCEPENATNTLVYTPEEFPPNGRTYWMCEARRLDPTGARVRANHPVAVFGGHNCAFIPHDRFACDHIESQMPALETWGTQLVTAAIGDPNNANGFNVIPVMAALDGTEVALDPPQDGMNMVSLDAGEWHEFRLQGSVQFSANQGVMVSQYLIGQNATDPPAEVGDPAMLVVAPAEQWRRDYTFIAPTSYQPRDPIDLNGESDDGAEFDPSGQNYVLLTRRPGVAIELDGVAVDATWTSAGDYETAVVPIDGGTRHLVGTGDFGVVVYGLAAFTSYAYVAGLNLEPIFDLI